MRKKHAENTLNLLNKNIMKYKVKANNPSVSKETLRFLLYLLSHTAWKILSLTMRHISFSACFPITICDNAYARQHYLFPFATSRFVENKT